MKAKRAPDRAARIALFAEGDHPICDAAEFLRFWIGGFDSFRGRISGEHHVF